MNTLKNVLIVVNTRKWDALRLEKEIAEYLGEKGINSVIVMLPEFNGELNGEKFDLAITLGGDGTVLCTMRLLHGKDIPLLAINLGTVGFITEVAKEEWRDALEKYMAGNLRISHRVLLDVAVYRKESCLLSTIGVNEAVINSEGIARIVNLGVSFSDTDLGNVYGDGIIISTPTGSTAYSMAAGGPIMNPEMQALIFTPVCPFSLSNRPLVTTGDEIITIRVHGKQRARLLLTIDGQETFELLPGDELKFKQHSNMSSLILSDKRSFFDVVRTKFRWTGGPRA